MFQYKHLIASVFILLLLAPTQGRAQEEKKPQAPARAVFLNEDEALAFLKSLPRDHKGPLDETDCKTYEDKNIDRLGRPFVMLAASFLKAFTDTHGQVTITSAHRSSLEQRCVCMHTKLPCSGWRRNKQGKLLPTGGRSRHHSGRALDARAGTGTAEEYRCMQEFAKLNPVFGIHFPLGMNDPPHMEPRGKWGLRAYLRLRASSMLRLSKIVPCTIMERMHTRTYDD